MKCYIASGWFNDLQEIDLQNIKGTLDLLQVPYYSPKDENLCDNFSDPTEQRRVFAENIINIVNADFLVVNTRDKDMGTIFEAGVAFAHDIPIIYYCEGLKGNFNLMLSRSGIAVATDIKELYYHIKEFRNNTDYYHEYTGTIE